MEHPPSDEKASWEPANLSSSSHWNVAKSNQIASKWPDWARTDQPTHEARIAFRNMVKFKIHNNILHTNVKNKTHHPSRYDEAAGLLQAAAGPTGEKVSTPPP